MIYVKKERNYETIMRNICLKQKICPSKDMEAINYIFSSNNQNYVEKKVY